MKKSKLLSFLLTAVISVQLITVTGGVSAEGTTSAETVSSIWEPPLSINEPLPDDNVFGGLSRFNFEAAAWNWDANGITQSRTQIISCVKDANGGYLKTTGIEMNYVGFKYTSPKPVAAGKYKFTGWFRTANEGEVTALLVRFFDTKGGTAREVEVFCTNEWIKVETYMEIGNDLDYIHVRGSSTGSEFVQDYCLDNFSLVPVDSIPANVPISFGTPVTPTEAFVSMTGTMPTPYDPVADSKYNVNGIILNYDCDILKRIINEDYDVSDIYQYAKQFEGTHVTDFFININDITAAFPSESWTDVLERYHTKTLLGQKVDFTNEVRLQGAYRVFEMYGTDHIGIMHEAFWAAGINPWLSVRMNDVHDLRSSANLPHPGFSDFFYKNPNLRREIHLNELGLMSYFGYSPDFTYEQVRDYYLALINDALGRYDTYGVELDFQREIWLFHPGGEYKGVQLMNDFMQKLDDMTALYEEKYGHEIKVAVRVASDITTNYEFGLDVAGWASKGLIDLVTVTARYETTNTDMPISVWDSILTPYGVELAAGIDVANLAPYYTFNKNNSGLQDMETVAAFSANALSHGADKIYLFNYFKPSKDFEKNSMLTVLSILSWIIEVDGICLPLLVHTTSLWNITEDAF